MANQKAKKKDYKPQTAKELLDWLKEGGLIGMWKDRPECQDSQAFARSLRAKVERRDRDTP